jgi:hypothetical protein
MADALLERMFAEHPGLEDALLDHLDHMGTAQ